ncbi:MAG: class I SAM-dependent methyltransferase [Acetobacteraceae bacterium]|nr:class I SAM-dependent methyltransferase [Acetobacteraceae bacterium]
MIPVVSWLDLASPDTRIETRLRDDFTDGNISGFELEVINRLIASKDPELILEIGTFDGRTTLNLAANSRPDARIYTLDLPPAKMHHTALPLEAGEQLFIDKAASGTRFAGTDVAPKITQMFGDSAAYDFRLFSGKIDLVFIDGSHAYEYVRRDSATAMNLLRQGGIILWHDYVPEGFTPWPGVRRALHELHLSNPAFRDMRHIAGTSLVFLQLPGSNSLLGQEKPLAKLDSSQPEKLKAALRVELSRARIAEEVPLEAKVSARNIGSATWLSETAPLGPVRLGVRLLDAGSDCIDPNFARYPLPAGEVAPEQTVEFQAEIPCPPRGRFVLEFDLLAEGVAWFSRNGSQPVRLPIEVLSSASDVDNNVTSSIRPPGFAMTEQQFVEAVYRICLGRPPDRVGFDHWTRLMRSTQDPTLVLRGIMQSPEYAADLHAEIARLRAEIYAIRASTSWRLTAPLRTIKRAFS